MKRERTPFAGERERERERIPREDSARGFPRRALMELSLGLALAIGATLSLSLSSLPSHSRLSGEVSDRINVRGAQKHIVASCESGQAGLDIGERPRERERAPSVTSIPIKTSLALLLTRQHRRASGYSVFLVNFALEYLSAPPDFTYLIPPARARARGRLLT